MVVGVVAWELEVFGAQSLKEKRSVVKSLKHFKDDVREVREGFECGIKIGGYDDVKIGDVIEAFETEKIPRKLAEGYAGSSAESQGVSARRALA